MEVEKESPFGRDGASVFAKYDSITIQGSVVSFSWHGHKIFEIFEENLTVKDGGTVVLSGISGLTEILIE